MFFIGVSSSFPGEVRVFSFSCANIVFFLCFCDCFPLKSLLVTVALFNVFVVGLVSDCCSMIALNPLDGGLRKVPRKMLSYFLVKEFVHTAFSENAEYWRYITYIIISGEVILSDHLTFASDKDRTKHDVIRGRIII